MSSILLTCAHKENAHKYYESALRLAGWVGGVTLVTVHDPAPVLENYSGLLLAGGRDIHPSHWDPAECVHREADPDEARDALELPLIRAAWGRRMPILGICRGAQALNVALGGSLYQDIPEAFSVEKTVHHRGTADVPELAHSVMLKPATKLAEILGCTQIQVNSRHHQAVRRIAPGLRAVAWHPETRNGEGLLIEGVEAVDTQRFVLSVQWHPENLVRLDHAAGQAALKLFQAFAAQVQ